MLVSIKTLLQKYIVYVKDKDLVDGIYVIESDLQKNKILNMGNSDNIKTKNLQIWDRNNSNAQKFKVEYNENKGLYTLSPLSSNKNLGVEAHDEIKHSDILQFGKDDKKTQKWYLIPAGGDLFYISSASNNLFVDVRKSNTKNGTGVRCWEPNGTKAQKFRFIKQAVAN